jgi:uncharacterized protein (TIGR02147 family)
VTPTIFEFNDYKAFVVEHVKALPRGGHGQYRRMAKHLRVHTTLLSHVFRGDKELSPEQACGLATFLGLRELEQDYLLALVDRSRAGSVELKRAIDRRLSLLRERHEQIEHRVPGARTLSAEHRATFYSSWVYSAVRMASSLEDVRDAPAIAARLSLPQELVDSVLQFLLAAGLLSHDGERFQLVSKRTHVGASSPLAAAHHRNWRTQAMNRYERMTRRDFAFTSPVSVSREDARRIRELLVETVASVTTIVGPSECETLAVLNIDWLEL